MSTSSTGTLSGLFSPVESTRQAAGPGNPREKGEGHGAGIGASAVAAAAVAAAVAAAAAAAVDDDDDDEEDGFGDDGTEEEAEEDDDSSSGGAATAGVASARSVADADAIAGAGAAAGGGGSGTGVAEKYGAVSNGRARAWAAGRDDSNNGDSNDGDEPWVAKILDSIADVWHVVIPITDDVTSAWLLASATSSSAAADGGGGVAGVGPLWWVCLAALVAAGAERAWLLAALTATAAVVPLMWLSQAALAAMSWCARLCAVSPACTVCCLLSICCCCAPCLAVASARGGARGWGSTAARLFARMTGARAAAAAAAAGAKRHRNGAPAPPPTTGGGHPNILLFSDALLWAVVGSRARCSRFWDGLGLCLDGAGAKPRDGGGDSCGGEGEAAFGSVVDVWVDFHPFGWLGRAVFGRRPLPMGSSFWGRWCSCSCCGQGEGRKPSGAGTGGGGAAASARGSNDTSSSSGYNDAGEGPGDEESPPLPPPPPPPPAPPSRSSPRRRRRGRVLVRAVGETLVVDGLFLALSATAGGGWDGSLTGIAGMSGLFSALQLLAGLRYYVREASDALEQVDRPDRDVGGGGGWKGSGADEDSSEGWSSASGSDRFSFGEEGSVSSSEQSSVFGQKGVGGFERVSAPAIYPGDSGQEPVWVGQAVSNV